jgi:hypothetical protein
MCLLAASTSPAKMLGQNHFAEPNHHVFDFPDGVKKKKRMKKGPRISLRVYNSGLAAEWVSILLL